MSAATWQPPGLTIRLDHLDGADQLRAVDHEGEALESYAAKTRDKPAAHRFLKKAMKRYGSPKTIVTERLDSCGTATKTG